MEGGVGEIEGLIRFFSLGLQERIGRKIDARERIVSFIPESVAYLLNRLNQGEDGKVPYERIRGKRPTILGLEFGEKLMYKLKRGPKLEKIKDRWEHGIFLGVRRKSNELWIGTREGIKSVRSVKRIPIEQRWGEDNVNWIQWAPWRRYKDAVEADGDLPEGVPAEELIEAKNRGTRIIETRKRAPREFYISKKNADDYGYTRGCGGCTSWHRGLGRQPHTPECRERFRQAMAGDAKVKSAQERRKEFEEREVEKKRKKEEKKERKKRNREENEEDRDLEVEGRLGREPASGSGVQRDVEPQDELMGEINYVEIEDLIGEWVAEVQELQVQEVQVDEWGEDDMQKAWDDMKGGELPMAKVREARKEEVTYMEGRKLWDLRPIEECWEKLGKAPVSMRWVDTNKGNDHDDGWEIRCRLVARDFKGGEKHRDDLFAETPPLEAKRLLISRAMTRRGDGKRRKLLVIDARKAHLNSKCEEDVYVELPEECGCPEGMCAKLNYWLYGFRKAAGAWENLYSSLFEGAGFKRGEACGVVFYNKERDISMAVHGDDFTVCGIEEDLLWIQGLMKSWFEIKVRAMLGHEEKDDKEVVLLGRVVRWLGDKVEWEADPKHREKVLEYFGMDEGTRALGCNGDKDCKEEVGDEEELGKEESTVYRGLAARLNFMSQDCQDLQFPIKPCSREMAKPKKGSWRSLKKVARYLLNREKVVWEFELQDEPKFSHTVGDSDWGGNVRDRKSTSGGVWMLGKHCIKTWCASQGAFALSSAEAEFYAMIEAITRAKGLLSLSSEMGFGEVSNVVHLGTDSSAAKSFVSRRGLGKMRHVEIRDLWLQKEVREGKVLVHKIVGTENPADLMTKILTASEIGDRLRGMNIRMDMIPRTDT